ncbi:endoglucanase [Marinitoga hydrogenitolerans DSM 16785]|uniref:Endoglucanase n=1 Tax=Marinitoga hydrogenitolerans (strain DSM 16785 / JCM 12826 / AT1271) TaxID=1122195 RepID=A0A1M4YRU5_MARH1|nr:M20/M25/M40 family metallo-hydrolase [Marinitoga hydrogenitolerans]SHF08433.1 endoglucanase [Marinitoga hydrogenitolerans DSM 16785]
MNNLLKYLSDLTELPGISGKEDKVREYILEKIKDKVDEYHVDVMGNLITKVKGKDSSKKIMLLAHMDEVGFMVTKINDDGTFHISPVGGGDPRVVFSQRLMVNGQLLSVVQIKPIHLLSANERKSKPDYNNFKIYTGLDKNEIKKKVKIGDMVTFDTKFYMNENRAISKAFDDRAGCSWMMNLIDTIAEGEKPKYDTYFAFVVQEEVGLRGSGVAAHYINPDVALVLEGTTAGDYPLLDKDKWATHLGDGPATFFMHSGVVLSKDIFDRIVDTAKANDIKLQFKMRTAGGTDARRLAITLDGIPSGILAVPSRYIHSPNTIIDINDYINGYKLLELLVLEGRILK